MPGVTDADIARWRSDTPGTRERNHLNNAGAGLMPAVVLDTMVEHLQLESRIGGYEASDARADEIARGYQDLARLVGADARNVAVVGNATAGFVQALSSFDFARGDVIVTSRCDYISNQIQYLSLAQRTGVEIAMADDLPEGGVDASSVEQCIQQAGARCRLVAITWIPTNSGLVQDVASVGEVCERHRVPFLVDGCQAVGQIPIDLGAIRCDYFSATARKFLRGPRGIGFMCASDRALERGDYPLFVDMRGARWTRLDQFEIDPTARRYEDWEFPYALVLGQAAAARYALDVGIECASARAWMLARRLRDGLSDIDGVRVLDRGRVQCAIVTFAVNGVHAGDIGAALAQAGINYVLTLLEFGRYDFESKGVDSAIRLSPHYYNTEAEIDAAVSVVERFVAAIRHR